MKKVISVILLIACICVCIVGCGSKEYKPEQLGEYGNIYKSEEKEEDESYAVINIASVKKKDNKTIIVDIGAPTAEQIAYAYKKFLSFNLLDEKGNSITVKKITLTDQTGNENVEARFTLTFDDASAGKYLEIGPYKMNNGDTLVFKVS